MARIRTVKPEFFQDEKLAPLPVLDRFVFLGLISMADDFGRVLDNLRIIDAFIFPETEDSARESLANLSRIGRVLRGKTASGQRVLQIANWERHQKVDKPQVKMALPEIVEYEEVSIRQEPFANHSRTDREPLAPHTTDQRPVPPTNDHRPPTEPSALAALGRLPQAAVVDDSPYPDLDEVDDTTPPAVSARAGRETAAAVALERPKRQRAKPESTAEFPHFTQSLKEQLFAVWGEHQCPLVGREHGRFVKAFARWFLLPEVERPERAPRDAEVVKALTEILSAKKHAFGGDKLSMPEYASERIGHVVEILREEPDPVARIERIDQRLGLRVQRQNTGAGYATR